MSSGDSKNDPRFAKLKLGQRWTDADTETLKHLYITEKKDLVYIAEAMGRGKKVICDILRKLSIVKYDSDVRGYDEFDTSEYNKLLSEYYSKGDVIKKEKGREDRLIVKGFSDFLSKRLIPNNSDSDTKITERLTTVEKELLDVKTQLKYAISMLENTVRILIDRVHLDLVNDNDDYTYEMKEFMQEMEEMTREDKICKMREMYGMQDLGDIKVIRVIELPVQSEPTKHDEHAEPTQLTQQLASTQQTKTQYAKSTQLSEQPDSMDSVDSEDSADSADSTNSIDSTESTKLSETTEQFVQYRTDWTDPQDQLEKLMQTVKVIPTPVPKKRGRKKKGTVIDVSQASSKSDTASISSTDGSPNGSVDGPSDEPPDKIVTHNGVDYIVSDNIVFYKTKLSKRGRIVGKCVDGKIVFR
jgi:hypothetical protein